MGTPEIISKHIGKLKSPMDNKFCRQMNYNEMIKSNITSFREAVDIWNNNKIKEEINENKENFSSTKKSRNDVSKGFNSGKENRTADSWVEKKKKRVNDYLSKMKSFKNFKFS